MEISNEVLSFLMLAASCVLPDDRKIVATGREHCRR